MAEVYEVATFYHHFDVVKENETPPPGITVRVCDSISCDLAGSHDLLAKLPALLGPGVRVLHAPCVGRCETAPVAVVGQNPIPHATAERVRDAVEAGDVRYVWTNDYTDYTAYRAAGGYALAASCIAGKETRRCDCLNGRLRPAWSRWSRFPSRPKVEDRLGGARSAPDGNQHRRRRARNFQGSLLSGTRSAPFLEGALIAAWAVGIEAIYIYLRDEYHGCRAILEREIVQRSRRIRRARFRQSISGAARALTSAARNPQ